MRIGFYGDSYCATYSDETWLKFVTEHYKATCVHTGYMGTGIHDLLLLQLPKDNYPEIMVFCYSDYNRLFNRTFRGLKPMLVGKRYPGHEELFESMESYYKHLHDEEKAKHDYISSLYYFDHDILSKVNSKIVHTYSFENYGYTFKHGKTLETPLFEYSHKSDSFSKNSPNHLNGYEINRQLANDIINLLDSQ